MKRDSEARIDLGVYLILVAGAVLIVSALVPGFKVSGLNGLVNTTEKLWDNWEGKVALGAGAAMVVAAAVMLVVRDRGTRMLLSGLAAIAALAALGSGSYAIAVFHSKTVDALASVLAARQGAPVEQARALVKAAANSGALQLSGKIGIYLLIVSASVGFLAAAFVMTRSRRTAKGAMPAVPASPPAAEAPSADLGVEPPAV
jgi:hypothetical protein